MLASSTSNLSARQRAGPTFGLALISLLLSTVVPLPAVASDDTTAPVLESLSLQVGGPFVVGDEVTIQYSVDDPTDLDIIGASAGFEGPHGLIRGTSGASPGLSSSTVEAYWSSGEYRLQRFELSLRSSFRIYHRSGAVETGDLETPDQTTVIGTHDFDFSALDFVVDNPDFDTEPPILESLGLVSPSTISPGDEVALELSILDDDPNARITVEYRHPDGASLLLHDAGTPARMAMVLDDFLPRGDYVLEFVEVTDGNSNYRTYWRDSHVDVGWSQVNQYGTESHSLDFAAADFTLVDEGEEVSPPVSDQDPSDDGESSTPTPSPLFTDIAGTTHEAAIQSLAEAGITTGYPDGTFRPEQTVTRAQMATFLTNALDLPAGTATFSDIAGTTHEAAIQSLAEAGITTGYPDGTFRPEQTVTRAQMATFLTNALGLT